MRDYCVRPESVMQDKDQSREETPAVSAGAMTTRDRRRRVMSEPQEGSGSQKEFDFYLAVAEEDLEEFGLPFCKMVEKEMKMRPCLTLRDIGPGYKYENMAEALETRCGGKVVFVVSKSFADSDECQFLVQFAKTLDPNAVSAKLIPLVIDKNVTLPRVLQGLSCIHYNAAVREFWLTKRLREAIHGGQLRPSRWRRGSSPAP